jgi:hypothetical protein
MVISILKKPKMVLLLLERYAYRSA